MVEGYGMCVLNLKKTALVEVYGMCVLNLKKQLWWKCTVCVSLILKKKKKKKKALVEVYGMCVLNLKKKKKNSFGGSVRYVCP